ncbi:replication-relaxation family protein [Bacillus cereus]|uniref:Replication-relaxation family protein n=1 Tax=Bacillus thuringiensis TaxID=1428 RepID=A0A9X6KFF3_BACTU|nr:MULTISPECIES: replication-relaxation family protein [Bacillus cereus group]MDA2616154.1 replication-relaxation family protein [Bacillus cereus]MDZ4631542.1 replication-relaxation family protein [Bacillus cereus]MEB8555413.1 replication-relaxation family protein [Bacillus cereus]MEB8729438.1 replication-relaxation family protein [Bacillus cereus]MEB8824225.1 replication-relaxation family protein [Bacillus cereus]
MSGKVYKYRRSGTKKHFHLKEADIFVFTVLYYKRALTTRQITQLYSAFEGREYSEASIFTKLDRYSQYGAMLTKKIDKKADSITKRALFSLKEKTIEFLMEIGRISKKSSKRRYSRATSFHTMCSREVMIRTLLATTKKTQTNEILYKLDIRSFYQKKNVKIEDNQLALIPDEHISYQNKNIHIEMDMCKETNSTLVEKVEKYIEYTKKTNEDVTVVFVMYDKSLFLAEDAEPPYVRMKNLLFSMRKYHELLMNIPNLNVHICSLKDAGDVISDIILGTDDNQNLEQDILFPLSQRTVGDVNWRYTFVEKIQTFKESIDGGLRRTYRRDKDSIQDFFFIFGNENDYRMIARLDDIVFSRREGDEGVPLVVIYPKRENPRDILLMDTYANVLLLSIQNTNIATDEQIMVHAANNVNPKRRKLVELY